MNLTELINTLLPNLRAPQKSERWAMYRLIAPVIDYSNATMGLTVYFEFNQTSSHGTSQSVDIALLAGLKPVVLIEAKRVGRVLSSDQVDKYLVFGTRGVVSDGCSWVLCRDGQCTSVAIYDGTEVQASDLEELVEFIRGNPTRRWTWSETVGPIRTPIRTLKPKKEIRAPRKENPPTETSTPEELSLEISRLNLQSAVQRALLDELCTTLNRRGSFPPGVCWKVRESRISVFNDRVEGQGGSHRVARMELTGHLPDVLVLNSIVEANPALSAIAHPAPHDKHPGMRRYRLGDAEQASRFGRALADSLSGHD